MGCSSPQGAALPNIPQVQLNRLMQISQISHPLNVNKKYEYLARIQMNKQIGTGLRKTYAYNALTTKEDIQSKRKQFWQTRTSGQPAIWQILHQIVSMKNNSQAQQLLKNNRVHMLNGTIQLCVDSRFNKYQVPIFCINQPLSYSAHREQQNLQIQYQDKQLNLTFRSAKFPNGDIKMTQSSTSEIGVIKQTLRAMKQLPDSTNIRFFYTGREMKNDKTIGNYNYVEGTIIQAMIT